MGLEYSPRRQKQRAKARKRQEQRWQKKAGPLTVRFVDPATLRPADAGRSPQPATSPDDQRRLDAGGGA